MHTQLVLPSISCDISIGQFVERIDIDDKYIAGFLANHELEETAIAETMICINGLTVIRRGKSRSEIDQIVTNGEYDPDSRTASVNFGSVLSNIKFYNRVNEGPKLTKQELNDLGSSEASKILFHELGHRIVHAKDINWLTEDIEYLKDKLPEKFWGKMIRKALINRNEHGAHRLANAIRETEVLKARSSLQHDHYLGLPSEAMADEIKDYAVATWPYGYYPVRLVFHELPA